jgi:hypothetical protein
VYKVISASSLLTYTWASSTGTKITGGQDSWKATITWGILDGRVTVKANNACGTSGPADLDVKIISGLSSSQLTSSVINKDDVKGNVLLVPNPANISTELIFNSGKATAYEIKLSDFTGKVLWQDKSVSVSGENRKKINMQAYVSGIYFITLIFNDGTRSTTKFIKQ